MLRRILLLAGSLTVGVLAVAELPRFVRGESFLAMDYYEYWSAGKLNARGENPYDAERMFQVQREGGSGMPVPILFWNPPWVLPLVMPLAVFDAPTAKFLWLSLNLALVFVSADCLWRLYGGPATHRWVAWLAAATFGPTIFVIAMGQVGPVLLLGVTAFLYFERRGMDFFAGSLGALTAIKPQIFFLFALAVFVWSIRERRWNVLAGGASALALGSAVAAAFNPAVFAQYIEVMTTRPPSAVPSPLIGSALRHLAGLEHAWLQYLPMAVGVAFLSAYWNRHRDRWDWRETMPLVLAASFLTAPHGAWGFDAVVLLALVVPAAERVWRSGRASVAATALLVHAAMTAGVLTLMVADANHMAYIWLTPALLLAHLGARSLPVEVSPSGD